MRTRLSPAERGMKLIDSLTGTRWAAGLKPVVCTHSGCTRWLTQRHLSVRNVGVTMEDRWYCSYRCLVTAVERRIERLLASATAQSNSNGRLPVGLALFRHGLLSNAQYKAATAAQKLSGGDFGELAVRLGFVTERQVMEVRAEQWRCPIFAVPQHGFQSKVSLPLGLMRRYSLVPLHHVEASGTLLVGFVHGIEYGVLYGIEQVTGYKSQPCFITPSSFEQQVLKATECAPEETVDDLNTVEEMRHVICNQGVLIQAHQIAIARCKDYLWARLASSSKVADVLLQVPAPAIR